LTGCTLFSSDTREAVLNCKEKASYIQDPLSLDQMYRTMPPNPNSTHGLNECLSRRGESSLESFHLALAHFGNCGMRTSLADNLNLTGTARHNLAIRHKLRLSEANPSQRSKIPAAFEGKLAFFNHTELRYINQLALDVGVTDVPFKNLETLPADNGERFFSEYLSGMRKTKPTYDDNDQCRCEECRKYQGNLNGSKKNVTNTTTTQTKESMLTNPIAETGCTTGHATGDTNGTTELLTAAPVATEHRANQQLPQCQNVVSVRANDHVHQQTQPVTAPQMMHWQMYQPMPPWTQPTMPFPTAFQMPHFCCGRCRQWHNDTSRRGRPPHDYHCRRRQMPSK